MIIWLSSYPKSGNTYVRAFLSAYYFSENGQFDFSQISNIDQFPHEKYFKQKLHRWRLQSSYCPPCCFKKCIRKSCLVYLLHSLSSKLKSFLLTFFLKKGGNFPRKIRKFTEFSNLNC